MRIKALEFLLKAKNLHYKEQLNCLVFSVFFEHCARAKQM